MLTNINKIIKSNEDTKHWRRVRKSCAFRLWFSFERKKRRRRIFFILIASLSFSCALEMSNIKPFWLEQRVYYKPKAMQSAAVASAAHVHQHTSVRFIIMMMCLRVYSFVRCSGLGHLDRENDTR